MHSAAWPHLDKPSEAVRTGGAVSDEGDMNQELPDWPDFARAIAPMMSPVADSAAAALVTHRQPLNVLEIGAGHAEFGIALAAQHPHSALTVLDWPGVLAVAAQNAARAGIADRLRTIPGNAFAVDLGAGYDLVIAANFLHMFGKAEIFRLLERIHAALVPGGRFAMIDFIVNEDRVSPEISAVFAMVMLTATREGDVYTFPELEAMCLRAGFVRCFLHPLGEFEQRMVVAIAQE
jgi:SAM-dependent methyltransferase